MRVFHRSCTQKYTATFDLYCGCHIYISHGSGAVRTSNSRVSKFKSCVAVSNLGQVVSLYIVLRTVPSTDELSQLLSTMVCGKVCAG